MFRILIIEDIKGTLEQLQQLLSEVFPGAQIDTAGAVSEAHQLISKAWSDTHPYHVIILDSKLPADVGENPEVDESVCLAVRDLVPTSLIAHITAYPQDRVVAEHIRLVHTTQIGPASFALSKLETNWANQLLDRLKAFLFGMRIEQQIDELFGRGDTALLAARARYGRAEPLGERSRTHELAALCRDISAYWNSIDDRLRSRVQRNFLVDTESSPIRVSLRIT